MESRPLETVKTRTHFGLEPVDAPPATHRNAFESPRAFAVDACAQPTTGDLEALEPVGFERRAAARVLDFFFLILLICACSYANARFLGVRYGGGTLGMFGYAADLVYQLAFETIGAASLGKLCLGLRVLQSNGRPCDFRGSLVRTAGFYFDALWFGGVGASAIRSSPKAQRHGDQWAKTVVVRAPSVPLASQRGVESTLAAMLVAVAGISGILYLCSGT